MNISCIRNEFGLDNGIEIKINDVSFDIVSDVIKTVTENNGYITDVTVKYFKTYCCSDLEYATIIFAAKLVSPLCYSKSICELTTNLYNAFNFKKEKIV